MNQRENLLRAVRFETPETIPMVFHINPACWQHYPHDALQELVAAHPSAFPGLRAAGPGHAGLLARAAAGCALPGSVGLRVAHLRGRHHRHRHRASVGRLGRVRGLPRARSRPDRRPVAGQLGAGRPGHRRREGAGQAAANRPPPRPHLPPVVRPPRLPGADVRHGRRRPAAAPAHRHAGGVQPRGRRALPGRGRGMDVVPRGPGHAGRADGVAQAFSQVHPAQLPAADAARAGRRLRRPHALRRRHPPAGGRHAGSRRRR